MMRRVLATAGAVALMVGSAMADSESSAEQPLVRTAMEFVARASSTSEVLTLNLTNLLILLVLKAFIFGFGLFSVGGLGRSADGGSGGDLVTESDMTGAMCFMMYTSGVENKLACLERFACEDPYSAKNYLTAAKMWYKMHKLLKSVIPFDEKYAKIMYAVETASEYGFTGEDCSKKFDWF